MQQQPVFPAAAPAAPAFPAAGQVPGQVPGAVPPATPTWKNMKSGFGTPVSEFLGQCVGWARIQANFGAQIQFSFARCQILAADTPYPRAEVQFEVKYSESTNSAWGKFGTTLAEVQGLTLDELDIDQLVGKWIHCYRYQEDYGINQANGQQMIGQVWKAIAIVPEGTQVIPITGTSLAAPPVVVTTPAPNQSVTPAQPAQPVAPTIPVAPVAPVAPANVQVAQPVAQPGAVVPAQPVQPVAPVAPVAAVAPVTPVVPVVPPAAPVDATEVALDHLDGKNVADFFASALPDERIRADAAVNQQIMGATFIEAMLVAGRITVDADGIHHKPGAVAPAV